MKTDKLQNAFEELAYDLYKKEYSELDEKTVKKAAKEVAENLIDNDDFMDYIRLGLEGYVDKIYHNSILPVISTHFDVPNKGDVTMEYDGRKIILHRDAKDNRKATAEINDSVFPVYWFSNGDISKDAIIDNLVFLLENLPYSTEIKYPCIQIWHSLDEWKRWAFYSDEELAELEKILENVNDDNPDNEDIRSAWDSRSNIINVRKWWPHHVKEVISFDKVNRSDKTLIGRIHLALLDGRTITIDIGAGKRKANYYHHDNNEYRWEINSFTAVDKPFPIFSERDEAIMNDYLNEHFKIKDA